MIISYDQVTHFNTFGFLKLPELFTQEEMETITRESKEIMAEQIPDFDGTKTVGLPLFAERRPFLAQLVDDDRIHDIPERILGPDFVFTGSGGHFWVGDTPWHGGGHVKKWPIRQIKVSMYLEPLNADNGCLRVIPGSHRNDLRLIDSRWDQAPDYLEGLRESSSYHPDYRPFRVKPSEVPFVPLESQPGDVLVHTEDLLHASFGGPNGRYQVVFNFITNPRTDEQVHYLLERFYSGPELRPPESYVKSDRPRIRRMVSRMVEIGFKTAKL